MNLNHTKFQIYCRNMSSQLQRQIQEEMDREAKIDRLIESKLRRFLRCTKNLKQVYRREDVTLLWCLIEIIYQVCIHFILKTQKKKYHFQIEQPYFILKIKINTMLIYTNILTLQRNYNINTRNIINFLFCNKIFLIFKTFYFLIFCKKTWIAISDFLQMKK